MQWIAKCTCTLNICILVQFVQLFLKATIVFLKKNHLKRLHIQHKLKNLKRKAEELTFSEGCAEVLLSKRIKSGLLAEGLNTAPTNITLKNDKNEYSFFNLLNKAHSVTLKPSELYLSKFPLFEKKLGAYNSITEDIETRLNSDSSDIGLAANLFVGCLICVENLVVCCVTIEVYNREFSNDVHAECFKISYPELIDRGDRYYEGIKTLVTKEKNGKQTMKKLIIGTTQFNLLVTRTVLLSDTCDQFVFVGPSCHQTLHYTNLQYAQILFRETHFDSYMQNKALKHHRHIHCR